MKGDVFAVGCYAAIGSVTGAQKAQKVLSAVAIPSRVIKIETADRRKGCVYGIGFSCAQESNVKNMLESSRIAVREWGREV